MRTDPEVEEKQRNGSQREAMSRRLEVVQGALEVLAAEGARGITHRAIDGHLKKPLGTTSNYFRRRNDLLSAVAAHIMERDVQDMRRLLTGALKKERSVSIELAAGQLTALFELWSKPENRTRALARLEIFTESLRDRTLGEVARIQIRRAEDQFEWIFEQLGSRNPALSASVLFRLSSGLHLLTPLDGEGPDSQTVLSLMHHWLKISLEVIAEGEAKKGPDEAPRRGGRAPAHLSVDE